jgi:hypothetical protein
MPFATSPCWKRGSERVTAAFEDLDRHPDAVARAATAGGGTRS